jgi:hypothetical protein
MKQALRKDRRLSPPTFHQHDNASTHQDKSDDSGKRFHRGQGLVPVVPKLKHALTSTESARSALRKSQSVERTCLCERKWNVRFRRAHFDRTATWLVPYGVGAPATLSRSSAGPPIPRTYSTTYSTGARRDGILPSYSDNYPIDVRPVVGRGAIIQLWPAYRTAGVAGNAPAVLFELR